MQNIQCNICQELFSNVKLKANHIRWKHKDNSLYIEKSKRASCKLMDEKFGIKQEFKVKCETCKDEFFISERKMKFPEKERYFCSKKCSCKYSQSFVKIENHKLSMNTWWNSNDLSLKEKMVGNLKPRKIGSYSINHTISNGIFHYNFKCVVCNSNFELKRVIPLYKQIKTCSNACCRSLLKQKSTQNPNCGGETGYKKYQYKNIWMDSNWEVEVAKLLDSKNIRWERDRKKHMFWWTDENGTKRRYYPDFYLPDYGLYLDPKNKYKIKLDLDKIGRVLEENKIKLSWGLLEGVKKDIDNLK